MPLPIGDIRKALPLGIGYAALVVGQVLLARGAGPELFGRYSLVLAWVNVAVLLAVAGFQFSATKVLPPLVAAGASSAVRFAVYEIVASVAALSVASSFFLGVVVAANPFGLRPASLAEFSPGFLLVPLIALSYARVAIAAALGHLWIGQGPDNIIRPLLIGGSAFAFGLRGASLSLPELVVVTATAYGVATLLGGVLLWQALPPGTEELTDKAGLRRELRRIARYMGGSNIVISIMKAADLIVVGAFLPPSSLAVYVVLSRLSEMVNTIYSLIDPVSLPRFATLIQTDNQDHLAKAVKAYSSRTSRWAFGCLALCAGGGNVLLRLFGDQYSGNQFVLLLMALAPAINAFTGPGGQLMALAGLERLNFLTTTAASACYLALLAVATYQFGIPGAATAAIAYQLFRGLVQASLVKRYLGVDVTIFGGRPRLDGA